MRFWRWDVGPWRFYLRVKHLRDEVCRLDTELALSEAKRVIERDEGSIPWEQAREDLDRVGQMERMLVALRRENESLRKRLIEPAEGVKTREEAPCEQKTLGG